MSTPNTPRRLRSTVHVSLGDGHSETFGPGEVPPDWAAQRITNPKAWGDWPGTDDLYADTARPGSP